LGVQKNSGNQFFPSDEKKKGGNRVITTEERGRGQKGFWGPCAQLFFSGATKRRRKREKKNAKGGLQKKGFAHGG